MVLSNETRWIVDEMRFINKMKWKHKMMAGVQLSTESPNKIPPNQNEIELLKVIDKIMN